jgi:putative endonuclease
VWINLAISPGKHGHFSASHHGGIDRRFYFRLYMQAPDHNYYVYILTNKIKTVLYTGVTKNLEKRILEHYKNRGNPKTFTGKYNCYWLVHYERFAYINDAIARENEIKGWRRSKKDRLIAEHNPDWLLLNRELFGKWPPDEVE